jgi:uncharacterized protein Yka (UPF0111/DUF47 family)
MSAANSIIQRLIPKDKRFFPLFDEFGTTVQSAANSYSELLKTTDPQRRSELVDAISEAESKGDTLIHKIVTELTATFITPFDREDIHLLASNLDAILDDFLAAGRRIVAYKIDVLPERLIKLGEFSKQSGELTAACLHNLKSIRDPKAFAERIRQLQNLKGQSDDIFLDGMAELYGGGTDSIHVLKLREVYLATDDAMRNFQELSFALEAILIKTT